MKESERLAKGMTRRSEETLKSIEKYRGVEVWWYQGWRIESYYCFLSETPTEPTTAMSSACPLVLSV